MMMDLKLKHIDRFNLLNILYCIFPITIALGNLAINLNIFFIVILGLFTFKEKLFQIRKDNVSVLVALFFICIIISSFLNYYNFSNLTFNNNEYFYNNARYDFDAKMGIFKSLAFLRFFLIYFILTKLIEVDKFNIKIFFFMAAGISFFLIIDLMFQLIFHIDLFGNKYDKSIHRLSGFFGTEYIAGGFLQRFSLYLIFLFPFLWFKNKANLTKLFFFFVSLLVFFSILMTNNRMPLILFFLGFVFFTFFYKKFRKLSFYALVFLFFSFSIIYSFNSRINNFFNSYKNQAYDIVKVFTKRDEINNLDITLSSNSNYAMLFNSAIDLSQKNKILGLGIKSFYFNCFKNLKVLVKMTKPSPSRSCNNHPHNYYLEILTTSGMLGLLLITLIFLMTIKKFLFRYNQINENEYHKKLILLVSFIVFITEIFPIRSSGAFFTTSTAILIFTLLAIVNNLKVSNIKL